MPKFVTFFLNIKLIKIYIHQSLDGCRHCGLLFKSTPKDIRGVWRCRLCPVIASFEGHRSMESGKCDNIYEEARIEKYGG